MLNITISPTTTSRIDQLDKENPPAFGTVYSDHMFVMDYADGQWQEAAIRPFANFSIHPANLTLHYGQSIFEGMKASRRADGTPLLFRPDMHARRFNESAYRMCMPSVDEAVFLRALSELVSLDREWIPSHSESALYIRPLMFATEKFIGVRASKEFKLVIFTCPVGAYYSKPVSLFAEQTFVRAVPGGVGAAKTAGNYAASLYPAKKAQELGFDQVMWMDPFEFKYVQEVGTMNIFFVLDDKIITPALNGAILKGVTRDTVIKLLQKEGHQVEEKNVSIKKIIKAYEKGRVREVFGTGTAAVVSNVGKIAYGDTVMDFDTDKYTISPWIKSTINNLRTGLIEDPFGWVMPVESEELVDIV